LHFIPYGQLPFYMNFLQSYDFYFNYSLLLGLLSEDEEPSVLRFCEYLGL